MVNPVIIMAAPNGARKTHKDHPALPISIQETVEEAVACYAAGACALHAHVRGDAEEHVIDAGRYRELLGELNRQVPDMLIQITTEAVGIYTPEQQVECAKSVMPEMASVALREMTDNFQHTEYARDFYHWCADANIHIQHVLYSVDDLRYFHQYKSEGIIPDSHNCVLFVLGRYAVDFQSSPDDLAPFLKEDIKDHNWFTCAFGLQEQDCVLTGIERGGHARIGFENNLHGTDGELASSTASQIESLVKTLQASGRTVADSQQARQILGVKGD